MGSLIPACAPSVRETATAMVAAVQRKLYALGYFYGAADGIYGQGTQAAVKSARKALGLPAGENVDYAFYQAIGLILFE